MKHPGIDASLQPAEPLPDSLDDGFAPPAQPQRDQEAHDGPVQATEPVLAPKSPF